MSCVNVDAVLQEGFDRVTEHVHEVAAGLDADELVMSPLPGANPIGWILWHLTRVQDSHVAELLDEDQVWVGARWAKRFGLDPDPANTGYGHSPDDVAAVRPEAADALVEYHDAVAERTRAYLRGLAADDLDRVVDDSYDPPVTLGVRLMSIADDDIQHCGQAAYARGLLDSDRA